MPETTWVGPSGAGGAGGSCASVIQIPPPKWRIEIEYDGVKCEAEFEGAFAKDFLTTFVQDFVKRICEKGTA